MNVQLAPDVAQCVEDLASGAQISIDEAANLTLRIWFSLMKLCSCDPEADALLAQLIPNAVLLLDADTGDSR